MTTQRIYYATEFENICKALESVNLRSYGLWGRMVYFEMTQLMQQKDLENIVSCWDSF